MSNVETFALEKGRGGGGTGLERSAEGVSRLSGRLWLRCDWGTFACGAFCALDRAT